MKRIFLDTNFLIDYLIRDEYKLDSQIFLENGIKSGCKFYISYLSVANFAYISRKLPKDVLFKFLSALTELFEVISNDSHQIRKAIALHPSDFEDALQYQAALSAKCECIITRNEKDFSFSELPVLSATAYSERHYI